MPLDHPAAGRRPALTQPGRLLGRRLLLQVADARVLVLLRLGPLALAPGHTFPRHVRTPAYYGRAQQRTSSRHGYLRWSSGRTGCYTPSGRLRPRATMSSGAAATSFGPPTCGAMAISTPMRSSGVAPASSALLTCHK